MITVWNSGLRSIRCRLWAAPVVEYVEGRGQDYDRDD